ncbi:hypothetical protein PG5_17000 [Pseudomonas sp. G5(2012)]|nr:hypothetical protein PG5_17000 [Pseudomonas sp. G5(2012)]
MFTEDQLWERACSRRGPPRNKKPADDHSSAVFLFAASA